MSDAARRAPGHWTSRKCITAMAAIAVLANPLVPMSIADDGAGKQLLWGDLHIHTMFSLDAYLAGVRRTPADAYAFARGAPEQLADGRLLALDRPLDFAAVTDHGEYLAVPVLCASNGSPPECEAYDRAAPAGMSAFRSLFAQPLTRRTPICPTTTETCGRIGRDTWQRIRDAAAAANDPGRFTAFIGTEWSATPDMLHLHRNLIFAGDRVPAAPPNVIDQPSQEALWATLDAGCRPDAGCDVLAIPHNSNIGMGGTFRLDETDAASLRLRARFERLAEVFQHKGQSECFPGSPLADEACSFEVMLPVPVRARQAREPGPLTEDEQADTAAGYLRNTLGRGLAVAARTGINPFRYGLIGSTDTHAARPGYVDEAHWAGTFGAYDDTRAERLATRHYNPGGLVAVWAESNTRAHVFAALKRREAYATSGPRIALRLHQTFDADADLCSTTATAPATAGVTAPATAGVTAPATAGVEAAQTATMGGVLAPGRGKPRFAVLAMQDRRPLESVEIIKLAYRDSAVRMWRTHRTAPRGFTETCYEWRDDDYRPGEPALWYARVLEIPSPRWSATADEPEWIRERAWSSPIWALPSAEQMD